MKCSSCYADNATWASVCVMCGDPVVPVELCANGHILPPGSRDCRVCPSMWPETAPFSGPPVLRGILWVERGRWIDRDAIASYLEMRDHEAPWTLSQPEPDLLKSVVPESREAVARILVRPEGLKVCRKTAGPARKPEYEAISENQTLAIGSVRLRWVPFEVPKALGVGGT